MQQGERLEIYLTVSDFLFERLSFPVGSETRHGSVLLLRIAKGTAFQQCPDQNDSTQSTISTFSSPETMVEVSSTPPSAGSS
jgi:hypothetical protein